MAHLQFTDALVREYLISRGFSVALKHFDNDVKASKSYSFRVDKIMDILTHSIQTLDLKRLRSMWSHLEQNIFNHLEAHHIMAARELGIALLRRYLVQAASTAEPTAGGGPRGREKVTEFFDVMAPEIHSRPEWRDWFALPFLRNPEDHPTFAVYFGRQWQDTLTVSLHNFISIVFQCMPTPTLAQYQEESALILQLQRDNIELRSRLEAVAGPPAPPELPAAQQLMDDFSVVAHETAAADGGSTSSKGLRSLIRAIGSTSPGTGRRSPGRRSLAGPGAVRAEPSAAAASSAPRVPRSVSVGRTAAAPSEPPAGDAADAAAGPVLLGQESLPGHRVTVTHCRFNPTGQLLATCDMDGAVRLWAPTPPPCRPVCALKARSPVLACCWLGSQLLAYGTAGGDVRIYDAAKSRQVVELGGDSLPALKDKRVLCLAATGRPSSLLCSVSSRAGVVSVRSGLVVYDLKASREECTLSLPAGVSCGSAQFNHNGQLLLCACSDGHVRVYDGRLDGCISDWTAHVGGALTLHLSHDQTNIYTLGADGKFVTWSMAQTGSHLAECTLHERAAGPFTVRAAAGAGQPASQTPFGQLFTLAGRQHVLTCGDTGGRLYKVTDGGLEASLSLGGHVTGVLTCDVADNQCVTASLDGVVKTSSLLMPP